MIFIYLGGGRSQLWLTLLGLAVTIILNSGLLSNTSTGPADGRWAYSPPASRWQGEFVETPSLNLTWAMPVLALLVFGSTRAYLSIKRQGWRRTWHDFCDSVWNWRDAAAGQPAHHNTAISKRRRFEAVSKVVQQLPVELHATEEDLRHMSLPELKRRLTACGRTSKEGFDKQEAVAHIVASGNSSSSSCTICCDDYESGDALRILKCGHKYHVECIDKWLLCSTDYLRAPTCPICSAAIVEDH